MLNTDIDTFFDVSVSNALVDDDPDGGFCHVVYNTSLSMIDFVGHAVGDCVRGGGGDGNWLMSGEGLTLFGRHRWL